LSSEFTESKKDGVDQGDGFSSPSTIEGVLKD
jgi:hypothetical protein